MSYVIKHSLTYYFVFRAEQYVHGDSVTSFEEEKVDFVQKEFLILD